MRTEELKVMNGLAQQGIHVMPLDYEEKLTTKNETFTLDKDVLRKLAIDLQNVVIWRGSQFGKFDEHYHTPEYHLFSDDWEMFHIRVTRKSDGEVILSAMNREHWNGTEYDYKALLRLLENHRQLVSLMRKEVK